MVLEIEEPYSRGLLSVIKIASLFAELKSKYGHLVVIPASDTQESI